MNQYLNGLIQAGLVLGEWDQSKVGGLSPQFFWDRRTFVDFRGDLRICPRNVTLGFWVKLITATHDFTTGELGHRISVPVHIEQHAFIGSYALLHNCMIRHHARVGCGAVVVNKDVPPYTTVAGNPARIVSEWINGVWVRKDIDVPRISLS